MGQIPNLKTAEEALLYFLAPVRERGKLRRGQDLSLRDLYDYCTKAPEIKGKRIQAKTACRLLGIPYQGTSYGKLKKRGYFGRLTGGKGSTPSYVEVTPEFKKDLALLARSVPMQAFYDAAEKNEWHVAPNTLEQKFSSSLGFKIAGKREAYVSLRDAARIAQWMKKRKAMIEDWGTIEGLRVAAGRDDMSYFLFAAKYANLREGGKVRMERCGMGRQKSWEWKMHPWEFQRRVKKEKRERWWIENGKTTSNLAEALGVHIMTARRMVVIGKELGLLHPYEPESHPDHSYNRLLLGPREFRRVVAGEIKIPSDSRVERMKEAGMSIEEIKAQLEKEEAGVDAGKLTRMFGERDRNKVNALIREGNRQGLLTRVSLVYPGSRRAFRNIISQDEATALLEGRLIIPGFEQTLERAKKWYGFSRKLREGKLAQAEVDRIKYNQDGIMGLYAREIGEYDLIDRAREAELAALIAGGDDEAKDELVRSNLRLVVKIAHDFKGRGLSLLDLISEGNIGMTRAAEKFDPSKGAKFSTYSAWWIKQAMKRAIANQSRTIRVPVQSVRNITNIKAARAQLYDEYGRWPTDAEVAERTGFSERTVRNLPDIPATESIHKPVGEGESESELGDFIEDEAAENPEEEYSNGESEEAARQIVGLLDRLDDGRKKEILVGRFGLDGRPPRTLEELSQTIGRTRERIRQLQNQALKELHVIATKEGYGA